MNFDMQYILHIFSLYTYAKNAKIIIKIAPGINMIVIPIIVVLFMQFKVKK